MFGAKVAVSATVTVVAITLSAVSDAVPIG